MMGFLEKIEILINGLLFKFGALMVRLTPSIIKKSFKKFHHDYQKLIAYLKVTLQKFRIRVITFSQKLKTRVSSINLKETLIVPLKKSMEGLKKNAQGSGKFKSLITWPFVLLSKWLQGLSATQSVMLLTFSVASFLSIIGIGFSGKKIAHRYQSSRSPASLEEIKYDRPIYYKEQNRHVKISNLRLPVYLMGLNEVKAIQIDFVATLSNRYSKFYLEKHDFQFRDHLIDTMEPLVPTFPLEEEGREIIRKKLIEEINAFLKNHQVEGEVQEVKITYALAN